MSFGAWEKDNARSRVARGAAKPGFMKKLSTKAYFAARLFN